MLTRRENLLIRPWQERRYIQHRQKVKSALPAIDTTPPPFREHVSCKLKKIQKESERCTQIISDNFTLLQHLSNIMITTRVDHFWEEPPPNFLQRVGIYTSVMDTLPEIAVDEEDHTDKKTRKDKCFACSPERNKIKTSPEERMPFSPPKPRLTKRAESPPDWESQYVSRCAVDKPEFRGQMWKKPLKSKPVSKRKKTPKGNIENILKEETQSIVLSRGGLSLSVKFPPHTGIVFNDNSKPKVIQKDFCECKSFPKVKHKSKS
ncbi:uncharacterized protein LOC106668762 [Cimex lectularius]|uniref:Uncharacterized protein n=1 Tax=Cimex lectularius TaxID=79782 RepID=A0A8I6RX55_CIMLE|nr:uncharacterized protein LOC106668762 [Cimex lectularius]